MLGISAVLDQIVCLQPAEIRRLFESYRLTLHDWATACTDRVMVRESLLVGP